jgi:threonine dehydrogenase-like Zn-dependent dehydrogenase
MADFVIEGTGVPSLMNTAQRLLRTSGRGRLVLMSSHEEACPEFDFRETIARSAVIMAPFPSYSYSRVEDLRRAVTLLNRGVFKVKEVVSHEFKLDDIQTAFETLENKPAGYLKGIVVP